MEKVVFYVYKRYLKECRMQPAQGNIDLLIAIVPAIELVCLMHPTEHAWYSHQQARLKCTIDSHVS